ncbi:nitrogenase component 1 [Clostridium sp.]|uniref:nitrogenase component 1 n=1 Tax=Clostridium sp. TaxID=1506 RepID=UPI0025831DEE|nr:nitrogenase component 1 [Clostridium sp.]
MPEIIEQPRYVCAIGAQQTVLAINKAIPILNSGPGCSEKVFSAVSFNSGYQGTGYAGGSTVPCTNTSEKEVVFGGEDRLKEVIDGSLKILKGDLFVVLTGCTSDIIGDDVGQVVSEYQRKGVPIVYAETGGFKGTNYVGHELVINAIQDPFWAGNLAEIKRLLEGIGLQVNILFGPKAKGVEEWKTIPDAEFNIVLSPWVGLKTAKLLKSKYGTPYLYYPTFPIGAKQTEKNYYYYLQRSADFFVEFRYDLVHSFFTITDSFYALGINKFLIKELGLVPGQQYITEDTPKEYKELIKSEFETTSKAISAEIIFETDGGKIHDGIRNYNHRNHKPLIIGSFWDKDIVSELKGYGLDLSIPILNSLILDKNYVGYSGALTLTEDIYNNILHAY